MKVQEMIMLESDEKHIIKDFEEALNLIGWHRERDIESGPNYKDMTTEQRQLHDEIKSCRRIRSDQFSMEDVERASRYIKRKADELMQRANAGDVFTDPKIDAVFSDGVRSGAQLALRKLKSFRDYLDEYRAEYDGLRMTATL
jgi:hypothetical protein